jgi:succinyl-CoA synthetase alpha subunit
LENDPSIELIIVVSKPPEEKTLKKVLLEIERCSKPSIINFLGKKAGYFDQPRKSITVNTLESNTYETAIF